jgi:hypothetical protein
MEVDLYELRLYARCIHCYFYSHCFCARCIHCYSYALSVQDAYTTTYTHYLCSPLIGTRVVRSFVTLMILCLNLRKPNDHGRQCCCFGFTFDIRDPALRAA